MQRHAGGSKETSRPFGRLEIADQDYAPGLAAFLAFTATFLRLRYASRRFFLTVLLYCLPISVLYFDSVFRFCVFTMVIRLMGFNSYFLLLALALCGCETTRSKSDKPLARLTLTVESTREAPDRGEAISVFRANPVTLNVQKSALLNETHVQEARLDDSFAGFTLVIQLTSMGGHLLEQCTARYPGRRFPIAVQFGKNDKAMQMRWLAAPMFNRRITDGILAFTPDASREEAELIVRGLNNTAIKLENQTKPKSKK